LEDAPESGRVVSGNSAELRRTIRCSRSSANIGIVARIFGIAVLLCLVVGFGMSWYAALPLAGLAYLAVPVLVGAYWGLSYRLKLKQHKRKLAEDPGRDNAPR
jgi:hypothetical protein